MRHPLVSEPAAEVRGVLPRAAILLRALSRPGVTRLGGIEIARDTGMPLQTVHRLLKDLARAGLTLQDEATKQWSLGPFAIALGAAAQRQVSWLQALELELRRVTDATRETTLLTVREGAYGRYAAMVESPEPLRLTEHVGLRLPLTRGATRKAILSALDDEERERMLTELEDDGIEVNRRSLTRQVETIRRHGYGVSYGEVTAHTVGVAVPLLHNGHVVGSLAAGGPEHRMGRDAVHAHALLLQQVARDHAQAWKNTPGPAPQPAE